MDFDGQTRDRLLSDCSLADAVRGLERRISRLFRGHDVVFGWLPRAAAQRKHFSRSVAGGLCEGQPAGSLLSGIRSSAGKRIAWNGGTGVAPQFRGRGIGKLLVQAAMDLYREREVDIATLEALDNNQRAIQLYQRFGYVVVDRLIFLQHHGAVTFPEPSKRFSIRAVSPPQVGQLDIYQRSAPWQAQWQSLTRNNGEALIVYDANGHTVGFALYRRRYDGQGSLKVIALHQCLAKPGHEDSESILLTALRELFSPLELDCHRTTHNLSQSNEIVCRVLRNVGFVTFVEQVHMQKQLR